MNEFIVWDKKQKIFITEENVYELNNKFSGKDDFYYGDELYPVSQADLLFPRLEDRTSIHQYIGKKDINNQKIYADCSIVEFETDDRKYKGYFEYDKAELSFDIVLVSHGDYMSIFPNELLKCIRFKIIDTIQENKLGLIS